MPMEDKYNHVRNLGQRSVDEPAEQLKPDRWQRSISRRTLIRRTNGYSELKFFKTDQIDRSETVAVDGQTVNYINNYY